MGLKDSSFYLSWMIYYFFIYLIQALLVAAVANSSIFKNSAYSLIFVWYLLYAVSLIF